MTRWLVRPDRPRSIIASNRNIAKTEIGDVGQQPQRRPGRAEQQNAPRRILGHPPPRDKEHQLATRKCLRESTPQTGSLTTPTQAGRGEAYPRAQTPRPSP